MKRIIIIAFTSLLVGCVGSSKTTQILTQSSSNEDLSIHTIDPAKNELTQNVSLPSISAKPVTAIPETSMPITTTPMDTTVMTAPNQYTIQVVALSNNKGFDEYTAKFPKETSFWSNKKMVNNVAWYTLLYGQFDNKEQAICALNSLPLSIKKHKPFIRSFAKIASSGSPQLIKL